MNFIVKKITELFSYTSKNRAAKKLLVMTDRQLTDIGLCRAKLLKGASAYPWTMSAKADVIRLDTTSVVEPATSSVGHPHSANVAA